MSWIAEKRLKQVGITIRQRLMATAKPSGLDQPWIEFHVLDGRKIVSRHDSYEAALKAAIAYSEGE